MKEQKNKKFIGDKRDFETGQIYCANTGNQHFQKPDYNDISESDLSSSDEGGIKFQGGADNKQRRKFKRGQSYTHTNFRRTPTYNNRETWRSRGHYTDRGNYSNTVDWPSLPSSSTVPPQTTYTNNTTLPLMSMNTPLPTAPQALETQGF